MVVRLLNRGARSLRRIVGRLPVLFSTDSDCDSRNRNEIMLFLFPCFFQTIPPDLGLSRCTNSSGSARSTAVSSAQASSMADTSTPAPAKGMGSLAILFVLWYAFNAYYNVSNKMVVRTWFFPYTCAFLQVKCARKRAHVS